MTVSASEDLGDQPWEVFDGHMFGEAVIVDPVRA